MVLTASMCTRLLSLCVVLSLGFGGCADKAARDLGLCEQKAAGTNVVGAIEACRSVVRNYGGKLEGAFARRMLALLEHEKASRADLVALRKKERSLKQDVSKLIERPHHGGAP